MTSTLTPAMLADFLETLADVVHQKLPMVNEGGCGVFAHEVSLHLEKRGVASQIIVVDTWEMPKTITEDSRFNHIALELAVGKTPCYFDVRGLSPVECGPQRFRQYGSILDVTLSRSQLASMLNSSWGWNAKFKASHKERLHTLIAFQFEKAWH